MNPSSKETHDQTKLLVGRVCLQGKASSQSVSFKRSIVHMRAWFGTSECSHCKLALKSPVIPLLTCLPLFFCTIPLLCHRSLRACSRSSPSPAWYGGLTGHTVLQWKLSEGQSTSNEDSAWVSRASNLYCQVHHQSLILQRVFTTCIVTLSRIIRSG